MKSNGINVELDDESIWQQIIRESEECQDQALIEYLSESVLVEIRKSTTQT